MCGGVERGKGHQFGQTDTAVKQADNLSLEVRGHSGRLQWDEAGSTAEVIQPKTLLSHPERGDTGACDDK